MAMMMTTTKKKKKKKKNFHFKQTTTTKQEKEKEHRKKRRRLRTGHLHTAVFGKIRIFVDEYKQRKMQYDRILQY